MKYCEFLIYEGMDLTFDKVEIDEVIEEVPEPLKPTQEMQERFMRNCERKGILVRVAL